MLRYQNSIQNDFNFDLALDFINKRLKQNHSQYFIVGTKIDKAMVLYLKGEYKESFFIMKSIEDYIEKNPKKLINYLYYNNLLGFYLDYDKSKEAARLYQNKANLLIEAESCKNQMIRKAVRNTLARYKIEFGDAKKSKEELLLLLPTCKDRLNRIFTEYYISLADLKLGNTKEAKSRMVKIHEDSRGLFIYDRIAGYLNKKDLR